MNYKIIIFKNILKLLSQNGIIIYLYRWIWVNIKKHSNNYKTLGKTPEQSPKHFSYYYFHSLKKNFFEQLPPGQIVYWGLASPSWVK